MGNKILRQRLRGPALATYYPKRVVTFQDLQREFTPDLVVEDEWDVDRLEHLAKYVASGSTCFQSCSRPFAVSDANNATVFVPVAKDPQSEKPRLQQVCIPSLALVLQCANWPQQAARKGRDRRIENCTIDASLFEILHDSRTPLVSVPCQSLLRWCTARQCCATGEHSPSCSVHYMIKHGRSTSAALEIERWKEPMLPVMRDAAEQPHERESTFHKACEYRRFLRGLGCGTCTTPSAPSYSVGIPQSLLPYAGF